MAPAPEGEETSTVRLAPTTLPLPAVKSVVDANGLRPGRALLARKTMLPQPPILASAATRATRPARRLCPTSSFCIYVY